MDVLIPTSTSNRDRTLPFVLDFVQRCVHTFEFEFASKYHCRARAWRTNILQLLQSIVFVSLIWLIDNGSKKNSASTQQYKNILTPTTVPVPTITDCARSQFLQVCSFPG